MAAAIAHQSGSATVRGYVVGQPTATNTVVTSDYPGDTAIAGTDVHHLRPTDLTGTRTAYFAHPGLKDGTAFVAAGTDPGDPQVPEAPGNFTDSDSWEPRDAVKGGVARMIFYMAVRYEGVDGSPDLEMNNSVDNGSSPYIGKMPVLPQWSSEDPPDAFEERRNDRIYEQWQRNRNPFIDHPEWATSIWS